MAGFTLLYQISLSLKTWYLVLVLSHQGSFKFGLSSLPTLCTAPYDLANEPFGIQWSNNVYYYTLCSPSIYKECAS
jgi:hypothetical protein